MARQHLRDVDLAAQSVAAGKARGWALPSFEPLTRRCRDKAGGDATLAATCDRIAEVFFEHSDTYIGRAVGGSLHKLATGDPTWLDRAHREQHERAGFALPESDGTPCGVHRAMLAHVVRMDMVGELPPARQAASAANR